MCPLKIILAFVAERQARGPIYTCGPINIFLGFPHISGGITEELLGKDAKGFLLIKY